MSIFIPKFLVIFLAISIPIILVAITLVIQRRTIDQKSSKFLGTIIKYFNQHFGENNSKQVDNAVINSSDALKNRLQAKLTLVYAGIFLFVIGNFLGLFYFIMSDLLMTFGNGGTEDFRIWTAMVITSPFSGGWQGSLPWEGGFYFPPFRANAYHETWNYIFATSEVTDNPNFLAVMVYSIIINGFVFSIIFNTPLLIKRVRNSVLPTLFFFFISMTILSKSLFVCFYELLMMEYGSVGQYGPIYVSQPHIFLNFTNFILYLTIAIIFIYLLFLYLGVKIMKKFSLENNKKLFMFYISLYYWISLLVLFI